MNFNKRKKKVLKNNKKKDFCVSGDELKLNILN